MGMTTLPSSSTFRTMPVDFMANPPSTLFDKMCLPKYYQLLQSLSTCFFVKNQHFFQRICEYCGILPELTLSGKFSIIGENSQIAGKAANLKIEIDHGECLYG